MLEIKHDMHYLTKSPLVELGYTNTTVFKICFEGKNVRNIADYLEKKYKMYQYVKNNGIRYGEHMLFFWSNGSQSYFDVTLNEKNTIEYNEKIANEIEEYIKDNYQDTRLYVSYKYHDRIDWDKVNKFINEYELDFNNIPFNLLSDIASYRHTGGNRLNENSMIKLSQIENEIQKYYNNKKIIFNNNIKGTVKEFKEGHFGVFKPRATRKYYRFTLDGIHNLEIV
jgi:hypothetical protein